MDGQTLVIQAAVLVAAVFQSATGIGFGLIAGPVLLLVMNSASAVQVTMLLSLLISVTLAPSVYSRADKALLSKFVLGTVAGVPIGVFLYRHSSIGLLKFTMGLVVLFMAVSVSRRVGLGVRSETTRQGKMADIGTGILWGHGRQPGDAGARGCGAPVRALQHQRHGARDGPRSLCCFLQCCPGKVAPTDGKSLLLNVLWPVLPGNDLKCRGRKWPPERSIPTRHNGG